MMDPGTIIAIVEAAGSILKLGSSVAKEFLGNDKVRDKLVDLNTRLRTFYDLVANIIETTPSTPSELVYPGADSILKTLNECKAFLEQYDRTLSASRSLGGAAQRAWLAAGPDTFKLEDFHKKIDRHERELHLWSDQMFHRDFRQSISTTALVNTTATTSNENRWTTHAEHYTAQTSVPSRIDQSPEIRANRRQSLESIPELPSPIVSTKQTLLPGARRQLRTSSDGPIISLINASNPDGTTIHLPTLEVPGASTSSRSWPNLPTRAHPRGPGHLVTLKIGSHSYKFNTNYYEVNTDMDGIRVVDWVNSNDKVHVRHFVSSEGFRILHTIPNDKHFQAFYLPRDLKHKFEIKSLATGATESRLEKIVYQFSHKPDRETFQQKLRGRKYLTMVQATKIHSTLEKDIARIVHLKVWRRDDQDEEPTFSFAAHRSGQESHHLEYKIRWFKKTPEVKGEYRLILRLYSVGSDLDYGPPSDEIRRKSSSSTSALKAITRRMSGESNQPSASHSHSHSRSRSRSSSIGPSALILYDHKGKEPPPEIRGMGDLEIEFANSELRKTFVNACFEAHRPARRDSTPSPIVQQTSRPPSLSLGPNQGPHELMGEQVFEMPSPSMPAISYSELPAYNYTGFRAVRFNEAASAPPRGSGYEDRAPETAPDDDDIYGL